MVFTHRQAVEVTVSKSAFDQSPQATINALKEHVGLSETARCKWVSESTIAVDTAALTRGSPSHPFDVVDILGQLAEKDIMQVYRPKHAVKHSTGPAMRDGNPPVSKFEDITANIVTMISIRRQYIELTIRIKDLSDGAWHAEPEAPDLSFR